MELKSVFLEISNKCNQKCIFCSNPHDASLATINNKKIIQMINELYRCKIKDLRLYGGEPFMNSEFCEIVSHSLKKGMEISIYTNASFLNNKTKNFLKNNKIRKLFVSVDGPTAEIHEKIRGVKDCFNKTIENIKLFIRLGITVDVLFTVCALNKDYIFETYQLLKSLGVNDIKCNMVSPIGLAKNNWQNLKLNKKETKKASESIIKAHEDIFKRSPKRKECQAGNGEIFVSINGDVYPCAMFIYDEYKIGNIFDRSLLETLKNSSVIKEFENIIKNKSYCFGCSFKHSCGGGCRARAFALSKKILAPDYISCFINKK